MRSSRSVNAMRKIVILGNFGEGHVGRHLATAARSAECEVIEVSMSRMYGKGILQKLAWRLLERKPLRSRAGCNLLDEAFHQDPSALFLSIGLTPLPVHRLKAWRSKGIKLGVFLTDDPFNPAHRTRLFVESIAAYDVVFTPRASVIPDLKAVGAKRLELLPFAYDVETHVERESDLSNRESVDIMFVGGADADRVPFVEALLHAGVSVSLYGAYWDRYESVKHCAQGVKSPSEVRAASKTAKIQLVLARRANRDGHVMRTFEAAAAHSCLIVEDTEDHRRFFGNDGEQVAYFRDEPDLVAKAKSLLLEDECRKRMADKSFESIVLSGKHSYTQRISQIQEALCMG